MQRVYLKSMAHRLNQILREHAKGASYRGLRDASGREQRDPHTNFRESAGLDVSASKKGSKAIKQSKQITARGVSTSLG